MLNVPYLSIAVVISLILLMDIFGFCTFLFAFVYFHHVISNILDAVTFSTDADRSHII